MFPYKDPRNRYLRLKYYIYFSEIEKSLFRIRPAFKCLYNNNDRNFLVESLKGIQLDLKPKLVHPVMTGALLYTMSRWFPSKLNLIIVSLLIGALPEQLFILFYFVKWRILKKILPEQVRRSFCMRCPLAIITSEKGDPSKQTPFRIKRICPHWIPKENVPPTFFRFFRPYFD
jgi:hypothetical protein